MVKTYEKKTFYYKPFLKFIQNSKNKSYNWPE